LKHERATVLTRRQFSSCAGLLVAGPFTLSGCTPSDADGDYERAVTSLWQLPAQDVSNGALLRRELVRCATLAASSHNTQCWKFAVTEKSISIFPDLGRRLATVDPDDHHLYVSLGCAAENLVQAALANGLKAQPVFEKTRRPMY
jgi:hypothetical protein